MASIAGTYKIVEKNNTEALFKTAGQTPDATKVAGFNNSEVILVVTENGDNYTFTTKIGGDAWVRELKFTLGKPFEEEAPNKVAKVTTTARKDGNKVILTSGAGGRTYEFNDSGVVMTLNEDTSCRMVYKKQ